MLLTVDERELWRLKAAGDAEARERLVERYVRLAKMLARRYKRTSEPLEDLEQVALLGLVHAVDRFDLDRGTSFSTFAVPTILGELRRHFRDRTWMLRVPRDVRDASTAVGRATQMLERELGRSPTPAEVADATRLTVAQVIEGYEATLVYRCESLDRPVHDADDGSLTVADRLGARDDGLRHAEASVLIEQLSAAALSDRDQEVLRLRVEEDLLQREIAERVGVSQMQVSRILRDAVSRLQLTAAA